MVKPWQSCTFEHLKTRSPDTHPSPVIQPNFRHRSAIGQGEGVSDAPFRRLLFRRTHPHHRRRSSALSSLLILEGLICELLSPCSRKFTPLIMTYSRVCEVKLNGDQTFGLRQQKYKVSDQLKTGESTVLFGEPLAPIYGIAFGPYSSRQKIFQITSQTLSTLS